MPKKDAEARAAYNRAYNARPDIKAKKLAQATAWAKANRAKRNVTMRNYRYSRRAWFIVYQIKKRADRKGLPFDLYDHVEDIQKRMDAGFCELTGYPFNMSMNEVVGGRRFDGPSVDRIKPELGYVYTNIRVVLTMVNYAMNQWGEDNLKAVMTRWLIK